MYFIIRNICTSAYKIFTFKLNQCITALTCIQCTLVCPIEFTLRNRVGHLIRHENVLQKLMRIYACDIAIVIYKDM